MDYSNGGSIDGRVFKISLASGAYSPLTPICSSILSDESSLVRKLAQESPSFLLLTCPRPVPRSKVTSALATIRTLCGSAMLKVLWEMEHPEELDPHQRHRLLSLLPAGSFQLVPLKIAARH